MIKHATRTAIFSQSRDAHFQKFSNSSSLITSGPSAQTVSSASFTQINQD